MGIVSFRLRDRKVDENSHFVNEDGTIDKGKKIDFTNTYGVLNPYFIIEDGVRKVRQFIKGCAFFDPERQKKEGYFATIENSVVEFKAGGDIILDENEDKFQIEWMKDHPHNTKSSFHNPDKHDKIFFLYDPKAVQKEEVDAATAEDDALRLVLSLKDDQERLRAIGNLFEETMGLQDDNDIYLGLRKIAKSDPAVFSSSIASKEKAVLGDIRIAKKYVVINKDAKGFYYEDTKGVILETTTKGVNDSEAELVKFLMSKEGREHYKQLQVKIAQAEIAQNAPAGVLE